MSVEYFFVLGIAMLYMQFSECREIADRLR